MLGCTKSGAARSLVEADSKKKVKFLGASWSRSERNEALERLWQKSYTCLEGKGKLYKLKVVNVISRTVIS
jgi:hypothetical protein